MYWHLKDHRKLKQNRYVMAKVNLVDIVYMLVDHNAIILLSKDLYLEVTCKGNDSLREFFFVR